MARPSWKRRVVKVLLALVFIFVLGLLGLYYTLQSPRFLRWIVNRVNQSISGEIFYDTLRLDLDRRNLQIRGLAYKNQAGETIVALDSLDMDFSPLNALRARLDITRLRASGLRVDQSKAEKKITPSTWRTTLRLILKRVSIKNSVLEKIDVRLRNGDEFHFDQATLLLTPQVLTRQRVELWVNESLLKPGNLEIHSSTLWFSGEIKIPVLTDFTFLVSEAKGQLTLQEITVGDLPATSLTAGFKIGGDTLYLEDGILQHADGMLQLDVDYTPKDKRYFVDIKTARPFPMTSIPRVHKELVETFKEFELQLKADMKGYRLADMTGDVELRLKTFGNTANPATPQQSLTLTGKMQKGVLQLKKFLIESAKTQVTATGSLDFPRKKLDVSVDTKNFDLATMIESVGDLELFGYADAKGTVRGDFKNPTFLFSAHARETGYKFLRFGEIAGNFKIDNNVLSFEGGVPAGSASGATVQVRTENIFKKEKRTALKTQFSNLDVPFLVENPDLKGKVSGTFDLEDTWNTNPSGKLSAKIDDFWLLDFHIGQVSAEGTLGDRKFIINPVTFQPPNYEQISIPKPAVFTFDDRGVKLDGEVLPGAHLTGHYTFETDTFFLDAELKNLDLRPVLATLEIQPMESYADGTIKMAIGLENKPTKIDIHVSRFRLPMEEGEIREAEPIEVAILTPRINFKRFRLRSGQGSLNLSGTYVLEGNSDLAVSGKLDLEILKLLPKYFREGSGLADVDLKLSGNLAKPQAVGEISFEDADVVLRAFRGRIEGLSGKLKLSNNAMTFEKFRGSVSEGDLVLDGFIGLKDLSPTYYDLKIQAREAALTDPGTYKMVFSGDFSLKGPADGPVLSGDLFITDGKYIRNFNITELILRPEPLGLPEAPNPFLDKLRLDLRVKSPGELAIKNNVAEMFLQSDIRMAGRANHPSVSGALEVLDGQFHYFKIDFENAKGTIDFRDPSRGPYVDINASKEFAERFSTVTVFLNIRGYTDNLRLNFTSDAGLEKRDIISLIFTGSLSGSSSFTGTQLAGAVLASQLTSILQSTLGRSASLDIIRLESGETGARNISRLVVGKRLTDRLSLEFKTDLGIDEPLQGLQAEYLLLDNALLKASQLTDGSFNFGFTLRWRTF